jgi:hypothetical protein
MHLQGLPVISHPQPEESLHEISDPISRFLDDTTAVYALISHDTCRRAGAIDSSTTALI